jgi:hypothetical protein
MTKCQEIRQKTITDHRQTLNNATRYARLKIQSEDHTGNNYNSLTATWLHGYNSLTATWLQQFDGNMVTTVDGNKGTWLTFMQKSTPSSGY